MSIELIEVEIPFAGIALIDVETNSGPKGDDGITQITSITAPTDTSVIWIDPESGIQSIYSGGGWVKQLTRTSADGAYTDENGIPYFDPDGKFYLAP